MPKTRKPSLAQLRREVDAAVKRITETARRIGLIDGRRATLVPGSSDAEAAYQSAMRGWDKLGEQQADYRRALRAYERALKAHPTRRTR